MTGGMDRRPFRAASLAERTRRGGAPGGSPGNGEGPAGVPSDPAPSGGPGSVGALLSGPVAARAPESAGSAPRRHCWVSDATTPGRRAAGLLVEWRQLGGAWQGRVAYVVDLDGEATLVEAWLPAAQLERAAQT